MTHSVLQSQRDRQTDVMNWVLHLITYVFVSPNTLQSQFTEKGFKKIDFFFFVDLIYV